MALPQQLKWLWVVLLFIPVILTTKIQFSCYPLITNGNLPPVCYQQPKISQIITDSHTHGTVLYNIALTSSDRGVLRQLSSNSDIPRVDYDSQKLQVEILGNKNTPPDLSESIFKNLIDSQVPLSVPLLKRLALNPNTSDSILEYLILKFGNDDINFSISNRSQLSLPIIQLLYEYTIQYGSKRKYYIFSAIASQQNAPPKILQELLDKAQNLEKSEDENGCLIYQGLSENLTLKEKLGGRKAQLIEDRSNPENCKKKPCKSTTRRNVTWGLIAGGVVIGTVLVIGSGGLLAPIALGAGALTAGTVYVAGEFLSQCPPH
ncbi:hypothetical protein [Geminocystis herdmanii]|uniref:hypothetical protein n=1 Tax=Geminocystis herdmanii TaxID=669359 RepID=UPI00034629F3|nr:hypothetical protein [Geminocystis herdmanii]